LFRAALKVTTRESGDGVEVRVCGTIASASRRKKDRLKPTGEGTGLGLSISYEIVTQHEQNFLGPLMRLASGDLRDHIVSHKNDHGPPYRRYGALLR